MGVLLELPTALNVFQSMFSSVKEKVRIHQKGIVNPAHERMRLADRSAYRCTGHGPKTSFLLVQPTWPNDSRLLTNALQAHTQLASSHFSSLSSSKSYTPI